jgi:hypothetical protein
LKMYPVVCTLAAIKRDWLHFSIASSLFLPDLSSATYSSAAFLMTFAATQFQPRRMSVREREPSDLALRMLGMPR